jgi:nucleoside-triphosphatase
MKILLTGEPHSGKSTLINKILKHLDRKVGFVTNEILKDGQRIGFELEASSGERATIAHTDYDSEIHVSKYKVKPIILDEFVQSLPRIDQQSVLYIDEIGQMQLFSNSFRELVKEYINAPNDFIGTLSKVHDDELIRKLKNDPNIEIIEITTDNQNSLEDEISSKLIY